MKRDAEVFLKAAQRLGEGYPSGCCALIICAAGYHDPDRQRDLLERFVAVFRKPHHKAYWWGDRFDRKNQRDRQTALCLAAAMVETGDL